MLGSVGVLLSDVLNDFYFAPKDQSGWMLCLMLMFYPEASKWRRLGCIILYPEASLAGGWDAN